MNKKIKIAFLLIAVLLGHHTYSKATDTQQDWTDFLARILSENPSSHSERAKINFYRPNGIEDLAAMAEGNIGAGRLVLEIYKLLSQGEGDLATHMWVLFDDINIRGAQLWEAYKIVTQADSADRESVKMFIRFFLADDISKLNNLVSQVNARVPGPFVARKLDPLFRLIRAKQGKQIAARGIFKDRNMTLLQEYEVLLGGEANTCESLFILKK